MMKSQQKNSGKTAGGEINDKRAIFTRRNRNPHRRMDRELDRRLMEEGKLKGSGQRVTVELNGEAREIELPEEIHTFNGWKARGKKVKKGEHSTIKFAIWKYTEKEKPEEEKTGNELEDAPISTMFMKQAAFFTAEQVEA